MAELIQPIMFIVAVLATFCVLRFVLKLTKVAVMIGISAVIVLYLSQRFM